MFSNVCVYVHIISVMLLQVRAFHAGLEYFVEVDIVLPTDMSVR